MSPIEPPGGDWIRGIMVRRPWATSLVTGAKRVENRPRPWSWRGWMLLHSGKGTDRAALRDPLVARTVRGRDLPLGAVIGDARLTDCHRDTGSEVCDPRAQPGVHHLVFADAQELALPVPATGALGPWRPTPDLVDLLQLPHLCPPGT